SSSARAAAAPSRAMARLRHNGHTRPPELRLVPFIEIPFPSIGSAHEDAPSAGDGLGLRLQTPIAFISSPARDADGVTGVITRWSRSREGFASVPRCPSPIGTD